MAKNNKKCSNCHKFVALDGDTLCGMCKAKSFETGASFAQNCCRDCGITVDTRKITDIDGKNIYYICYECRQKINIQNDKINGKHPNLDISNFEKVKNNVLYQMQKYVFLGQEIPDELSAFQFAINAWDSGSRSEYVNAIINNYFGNS